MTLPCLLALCDVTAGSGLFQFPVMFRLGLSFVLYFSFSFEYTKMAYQSLTVTFSYLIGELTN